MIDAYPLLWPAGRPRSPYPQSAKFKTPFSWARDNLLRELDLLGATSVVISTNMMVRQDGLLYANQRAPDDRGVAVYFNLNGDQQCIPCDKWLQVQDNLQAVKRTVEALRGLDRWGAKEMVNAAFRGFKALPATASESNMKAWHVVLGVSPDAPSTVIAAAYRALSKTAHPDTGGSEEAWRELQAAYKQSGVAA